MDDYLRSEFVPNRDAADDVADWWRTNAARFPRLAILVRKYLAAEATQANEERHLSAAALIFSDLRQSLSSEMLDWLLVCKINMRQIYRIVRVAFFLARAASTARARRSYNFDIK